jgi:hypothetical protein
MKSLNIFRSILGEVHDLMLIKKNEDWSIFPWRIKYIYFKDDNDKIFHNVKDLWWVPLSPLTHKYYKKSRNDYG